MKNTPVVKLGIVAVSRDCFPIELSKKRLARLASAVRRTGIRPMVSKTIIETENDAVAVAKEFYAEGVNAAVVYLGNFGPEAPATIFLKKYHGPSMFCAAAEESGKDLYNGRGDALCGLLNCSYNIGLRNIRAHIPERPVGLPDELAKEILHFTNIARVFIGLKNLKVFSFGPRPQDFFACNAPIKPLYNIGVEVMENSELDMLEIFKAYDDRNKIRRVAREMKEELGGGNTYPDMLEQLAKFELSLLGFMEKNLGSRKYGVFANKCWPSFEKAFGFVPCYVNSRLAARGIPAACEVDIYGAVSEYMCQLASLLPATILDINNSVPADLIKDKRQLEGISLEDLFMGFHCGNTPACMLCGECKIKYQLIMNRLMEDSRPPVITRGTLEGYLKPGDATIFRLQSTASCEIRGYLAEGRILDVDPASFGAIGAIGIRNFRRFYRHVLVGRQFPHHTALVEGRAGRVLFDSMKLLAGAVPSVPLPENLLYPEENPFA